MPTKSPTRRIISFHAPSAVHAELSTLARREGTTLSGFLRRFVADHLDNTKDVQSTTAEKEARPCA